MWSLFVVLVVASLLYKGECSREVRDMYKSLANASLTIPTLTEATLHDALDKTAVPESLYHLHIITSYPIEGSALDLFLAPRPWWKLEYLVNEAEETWILFRRAPKVIEYYLQQVADRHFVTQPECMKRGMAAEYMGADTWGNRGLLMVSNSVRYPDFMYVIYSTRTGKPTDNFNFVGSQECPGKINRWDCLFLPQTNCSMPTSVVSSCKGDCGPTIYFQRASADSPVVDASSIKKTSNLTIHARQGDQQQQIANWAATEFTIEPKNSIVRNVGGFPDFGAIFLFGLSMRFNSEFVKLVIAKVEAFRASSPHPLHPLEKCVAIHIRRGDRTRRGIEGTNDNVTISEFCKQHSKMNANGHPEVDTNTHWIDKGANSVPMGYGVWMNMGCQMLIPYGAATLDHYLNASRIIVPDAQSVFIMTDDAQALAEEIDEYINRPPDKDKMQIYAYPAGANHRSSSLDASAEWFASIMVAQQCEGLVGYHSSAAFMFIRYAICMAWRVDGLKCPLFYSLARHL